MNVLQTQVIIKHHIYFSDFRSCHITSLHIISSFNQNTAVKVWAQLTDSIFPPNCLNRFHSRFVEPWRYLMSHVSTSFEWNNYNQGYVIDRGRCTMPNKLKNLTHLTLFAGETCYCLEPVGNQLFTLRSKFLFWSKCTDRFTLRCMKRSGIHVSERILRVIEWSLK